MNLLYTCEPLLPAETAPRFARHSYTIQEGYCPGRYTCLALVLFRHRHIVELRRRVHVHANRSTEAAVTDR